MSGSPANAVNVLERLLAVPPSERARVLDETGDASTQLTMLVEHAGRMAVTSASNADAATDALILLSDQLGSMLDRARARRARARTLSYRGEYDRALATCCEGMQLAREAGDAIEVGRAQLASMHALGELGRLDDAIAAGEAARAAFLEAHEPALAARADLNIGTALQRGDDPVRALEHFARARPLLLNEPLVLAPLDNNRGEALVGLNDFAAAQQAFNDALANFQRGGSAAGAAIAESNLADVATRQGRLQAAMYHYEQARRALEGGASPAHLARLLAEQAEVMAMLGLVPEAIGLYEQSLADLDRQGLALEAARARTGLGRALLRVNRHSQAETALAAAATAFDELKHLTARARVDLLRAELAARYGRLSEGRSMAMRALATVHERVADAAAARLVIARLAMQSGDDNQALAEADQSIALARQMAIAPLLADALQLRAAIHRAAGRMDLSIQDLRASADESERVRGALLAERFRGAFHGQQASMHEELAAALLDRNGPGDLAEVFTVIERAKSRLILDARHKNLAAGPVTAQETPGVGDAALADRLEAARAELNACYSVLGDLAKDDHPRTGPGWRERVQRCEREVDLLEARLATTAGAAVLTSAHARGLSLDRAARMIDQAAAIIEYFTIGDEIMALVIRRDRQAAFRRIGSVSLVMRLLEAWRFQVSRALRPGAMDGSRASRHIDDARAVLADLAGATIEPMAQELHGVERLIIVPHGVMHLLPVHALVLDGQHLVQKHVISTVPSVALLAQLMEQADRDFRESARRPVVVGVADEQAPVIEDEACEVARALQCPDESVLLGPAATIDRVAAAMPAASLLHIACHGRFSADSPMGSGLRLADRWLTARDLSRMRLSADLVVLSGCETAMNLVQAGDEIQGLFRGFLATGAGRVLASLWRVDDSSTREFFAEFYGCLNTLDSTSNSFASAGQHAQQVLMARRPHPAFWAPFILAGRP